MLVNSVNINAKAESKVSSDKKLRLHDQSLRAMRFEQQGSKVIQILDQS